MVPCKETSEMNTQTAVAARTPAQTVRDQAVAHYYDRLSAWDFSYEKRYAVQKDIYSADQIDQVEEEYRRYIALAFARPDRELPVSEAVDPFHHVCILFTERYANMCNEINGAFLHHRPHILDDDSHLRRMFGGNTIELYTENFGKPDARWWNKQMCSSRCSVNPDA